MYVLYICMYVCMYVCMNKLREESKCIYVCSVTFIGNDVGKNAFVRLYVCMYVCMHVFVLYICVWVYWGDGNKFMYVCMVV